MKKDLGLVLGLGILAGLTALFLFKRAGKNAPAIEGDSVDERQLLYGEMPGGELVDFAAAKAKKARHA